MVLLLLSLLFLTRSFSLPPSLPPSLSPSLPPSLPLSFPPSLPSSLPPSLPLSQGMRIVSRPEDFHDALAACRSEATESFGDDKVLIEKFIERPR